MKKKPVLIAVIFCSLLFSFLYFSCNNAGNNSKSAASDSLTAQKGDAGHGQYLVTVAGCLDCHSHRQFDFFSGPIQKGTEGMGGEEFNHENVGMPGTVYAKNITSDTTTGIGKWTDAEIIRAITQGITNTGDSLFPLMPYPHFNQLPKQDILDIVAYIRTLPPINNRVPDRKLMAPISAFFVPLTNHIEQNVKPSEKDKTAYGQYLTGIANCVTCHTPVNDKGQPGEPFTGGYVFHGPHFTVVSANLTPDSATGIGTWTEERFLNKFKTYRDPSGYDFDPKEKNSYMPWSLFAQINDDDLSDIFAYLKSLKPVKHLVQKYPLTASK